MRPKASRSRSPAARSSTTAGRTGPAPRARSTGAGRCGSWSDTTAIRTARSSASARWSRAIPSSSSDGSRTRNSAFPTCRGSASPASRRCRPPGCACRTTCGGPGSTPLRSTARRTARCPETRRRSARDGSTWSSSSSPMPSSSWPTGPGMCGTPRRRAGPAPTPPSTRRAARSRSGRTRSCA